jgi:UDP-N-acetylmuramoylalanine--D-glutamate ligase
MKLSGRTVLVAGLGISGAAAARVLLRLGARVQLTDASSPDVVAELTDAGATWLGAVDTVPDGTELVVTSPGWRPDAPLLADAARRGVEVIGEPELAWRLRIPGPDGAPAPWLAVTGTNGKTTTVTMLEAILLSAGRRAVAAGNVGRPLVEVVTARADDGTPAYDAIAVELSSFQLHWSTSVRPYAATVLNVAPDHIDWHGSLEAYAADKAKIFAPGTLAVVNVDDEWSTRLGERAERSVGFTLGTPRAGELGLVDDLLVDRAFTGDPVREAAELAELTDVRPYAPHNVANALAAAALARAFGVSTDAVRDGLRAFTPDPHRIELIATARDVAYVNDSKATNPHAAAASLAAYRSIVWIAGGLLKGADVDDLVRSCADRLRGVVLMGRDRGQIATALARHAPNVPVVDVPDIDTGSMTNIMDRVVAAAARLAAPGDTVLLAPAGASFDLFSGYGARGDAFTAAVRRLAETR